MNLTAVCLQSHCYPHLMLFVSFKNDKMLKGRMVGRGDDDDRNITADVLDHLLMTTTSPSDVIQNSSTAQQHELKLRTLHLQNLQVGDNEIAHQKKWLPESVTHLY